MLRFDSFVLDTEAFELREDGEVVAMEPQVFEVLRHLVTNAGRLVPKTELLDEVWGDQFVSESALTSRIRTARRALGDDGRTQRYIKTVFGRGYRFEADVEVAAPVGTRGPTPPPEATTPGVVANNLPADRTPLFGRATDIATVVDAVSEHRLVSLIGIGGVGKTRLAAAAAAECGGVCPDGIWWVDLTPVEDADGVGTVLASAVGLGVGSTSQGEEMARILQDRRVLIVLDNAEHVADEVAGLLDVFLEISREPRFLVTSRVPMNLVDERRVSVAPLDVDATPAGPAVELFLGTADRLGVDLGAVEREQVALVCRRLDGLPLAIELAAAQLLQLDLGTVVERLDERFELLAGGPRRPERHASLMDVLTDTWATLDEPERSLLRRIAAFPGTFDLAAVDGVGRAAEGADHEPRRAERTLRRLLDRSLVVREAGVRAQYRLLETIKLFVRENAESAQAAQALDDHAGWCLDRVGSDVGRHLFDFELTDWCFRHHDDLWAAGRHLHERGRLDDVVRLVAATTLTMHCDTGPRAAATLRRVEELRDEVGRDALLAQLAAVGVMCGMATRAPEVIEAHGVAGLDAGERSGDRLLRANARVLRSWSLVFRDPEAALSLTEAAAADAEALGHEDAGFFADAYRAFVLAMMRRYDEAVAVARAVLADSADTGQRNYPTHAALAALTSITYLSDVEEMLAWADQLGRTPSLDYPMWSNQLVAAALHASAEEVEPTRDICGELHDRLAAAGREPFPDLLIPIATLAYRRGEAARAGGWLTAVRDAGVPTQSFQATVMYRRLRERLDAEGAAAVSPTDGPSDVHEVGAEALAWLAGR